MPEIKIVTEVAGRVCALAVENGAENVGIIVAQGATRESGSRSLSK